MIIFGTMSITIAVTMTVAIAMVSVNLDVNVDQKGPTLIVQTPVISLPSQTPK